eukprot:bmy_15087T0
MLLGIGEGASKVPGPEVPYQWSRSSWGPFGGEEPGGSVYTQRKRPGRKGPAHALHAARGSAPVQPAAPDPAVRSWPGRAQGSVSKDWVGVQRCGRPFGARTRGGTVDLRVPFYQGLHHNYRGLKHSLPYFPLKKEGAGHKLPNEKV